MSLDKEKKQLYRDMLWQRKLELLRDVLGQYKTDRSISL